VETPRVPHLIVDLVPDKCCAHIRLEGEVDIANVDQVRVATIQAIDLDAVEHLIVDCRQLDFLDSSGVKTLLDAHRSFNGKIALVGPKRVVTRILGITGLEQLFNVSATPEDAMQALHRD
jgi:anti-sigma B factor antagonist